MYRSGCSHPLISFSLFKSTTDGSPANPLWWYISPHIPYLQIKKFKGADQYGECLRTEKWHKTFSKKKTKRKKMSSRKKVCYGQFSRPKRADTKKHEQSFDVKYWSLRGKLLGLCSNPFFIFHSVLAEREIDEMQDRLYISHLSRSRVSLSFLGFNEILQNTPTQTSAIKPLNLSTWPSWV